MLRLSLVAACGLPIAVAALAVECRLWACGLSHRGTWALSPQGTWNLPRPGIEPMSPAWAGGLLTTGPPGKPCLSIFLASRGDGMSAHRGASQSPRTGLSPQSPCSSPDSGHWAPTSTVTCREASGQEACEDVAGVGGS